MSGARIEEAGEDVRVLRLLGLARRAGWVAVGSRAVRDAARLGELAAALIARDASPNALERVYASLSSSAVPLARCGTRAALGRSVGRGAVAVVGIRDPGLARRILGMVRHVELEDRRRGGGGGQGAARRQVVVGSDAVAKTAGGRC
jgi:ribosomal protein L7Ae-like RNA K-turn-binding protein